MDGYQEFLGALRANVAARSRTARGAAHTGVSSRKLPLLKSGAELEGQLLDNLDRAARVAWESRDETCRPILLRHLFQRWIEELNRDLVDLEGYAEIRRTRKALARLNPYYRIWEVTYHHANPAPGSIDKELRRFASQLAAADPSGPAMRSEADLAAVMAFADREIDLVIHPWIDGCGRFATVLVAWLALRARMGNGSSPLPRFGPREDHYKAMRLLRTHRLYMLGCLARGRAAAEGKPQT